MKVASSSASFARAFEREETTQLEWLDLCANELELDGVVFAAAHFPRLDAEYLAQLKKSAVDLGLTVAALESDGVLGADGSRWFDVAAALGAPLIITRATPQSSEPAAWGAFTEALKARAADAKRANITLALRDAAETLCTNVADLARASKDVDSAWLRYGLDASAPASGEMERRALAKAAIVLHTIQNVAEFATSDDDEAASLARGLARFRGFVVLDPLPDAVRPRAAFHDAIERFVAFRAGRLMTNA